jgi:lysophospholipase L1-like esterase
MERILIAGNSFVEGVGAVEAGWAHQVALSAVDATVAISGEGGSNTRDLLRRAPILADRPLDLVLIEIGLNDSRWRPSLNDHEVPLPKFKVNLNSLHSYFRASGAAVVTFLGLTQVDEALADPYKEDKHYRNPDIKQYDEAIQDVAEDLGAGYIGVPSLRDEPGLLFDGVHPSQRGHDQIAQAVLSWLTSHSRGDT